MSSEGLEDRYYFSDWGSCTCYDPDVDEECPFMDEHEEEESDDE